MQGPRLGKYRYRSARLVWPRGTSPLTGRRNAIAANHHHAAACVDRFVGALRARTALTPARMATPAKRTAPGRSCSIESGTNGLNGQGTQHRANSSKMLHEAR